MELVELVFPAEGKDDVRSRSRALCEVLEKTAVEVPDTPDFVVNRLLFPYLFDAVELLGQSVVAANENVAGLAGQPKDFTGGFPYSAEFELIAPAAGAPANSQCLRRG